MPTIFEPSNLQVEEQDKVKVETLANQAMLGTDALQVRRILLGSNVESMTYEAVDAERFVYVIRGKGQAYVEGRVFPLEPESVLWLEKKDGFYMQANSDGLEVLLCQAPAGE